MTGVIVLVMSEPIRDETIEVLCREETGDYDPEVAADILHPICQVARMIDPAADDPKYRQVVNDPEDVIILRTAGGIYFHDDLMSMTKLAIVSGDTHAFPKERNWYGFRYYTATEFWNVLQDED